MKTVFFLGLMSFICCLSSPVMAADYMCFRCIEEGTQKEITTCDLPRVFELQNNHYNCRQI